MRYSKVSVIPMVSGMDSPGTAGHVITRASKLIQTAFPDLEVRDVHVLGEGWDSIAVLLNGELVFRVPKRTEVGWGMRKEIEVLNVVRHYVTAAVPEFLRFVPRNPERPVLLLGHSKIEGLPVSSLSDTERKQVLPKIAGFLRELHEIPREILTANAIPWFSWTGSHNPAKAVGWQAGLQAFVHSIERNVLPRLQPSTSSTVQKRLNDYMADGRHFTFRPVLIHGDFSPEHILVNNSNGIGIIDFGDSGLGDPAYDVPLYIRPYYQGHMDETFVERQRFYHYLQPFHQILYGLRTGSKSLLQNGIHQIEKRA